MYFADFCKSLFKKSNAGILIWMLLNAFIVVFLMSALFSAAFDWSQEICYAFGFAVYVLSILAAFSPVGECILRCQNDIKPIKDKAMRGKANRLLYEVLQTAETYDPSVRLRRIRLYICNDSAVNAFAVGRKTICVTPGLLCLPDDDIKGVLAHEIGHLALKHTDVLLAVALGNGIVNMVLLVLRICTHIILTMIRVLAFVSDSLAIFLFEGISRLLSDILIGGTIWVWTRIGMLFCAAGRRSQEYQADLYAYRIGYGANLTNALYAIGTSGKPTGLFSALSSTHPPTEERIRRLYMMHTQEEYPPFRCIKRFYNKRQNRRKRRGKTMRVYGKYVETDTSADGDHIKTWPIIY